MLYLDGFYGHGGRFRSDDNEEMEKKIIVAGSLNPAKKVQDRVRVLDRGGRSASVKGVRLQRPAENFKKI